MSGVEGGDGTVSGAEVESNEQCTLWAATTTPAASAAAMSAKNSASSSFGSTPSRKSRGLLMPCALNAFEWICPALEDH